MHEGKVNNAWVGFSLTPLGKQSFAAVFAAPGEVAAEAEVSLRVMFIDLPQSRSLSFYSAEIDPPSFSAKPCCLRKLC